MNPITGSSAPTDVFLVSVLGLKKSGKTTVCRAIIASLCARGYTVAAIKTSHLAELNLDREGTDSFALAEAGAGFLIAGTAGQMLVLERLEGKKPFSGLLALVPGRFQFVVAEGGDAGLSAAVVVCLDSPERWRETVGVRRVPPDKILALSGLLAAAGSGAEHEYLGFPVVDIRDPKQREALTELILKRAGAPAPRGRPSGPLRADPLWIPG